MSVREPRDWEVRILTRTTFLPYISEIGAKRIGPGTYPTMNKDVPNVMTSVETPNCFDVYGIAELKIDEANVEDTGL